MKFVPRSLSAQLIVMWILVMLVTHAVAVLVLSWWRVDHITAHPLSVRMMQTRSIAAYRLVTGPGGDLAVTPNALLASIRLPDSSFYVSAPDPSPAPAMNSQEADIAQRLRKALALPPTTPVLVRLEEVKPEKEDTDLRNWLEKSMKKKIAWRLHIVMGLPNGQVLQSDHWPTLVHAHWDRVLTFSLLIGMIPTTLIALFFGRRIMRPLRLLTESAKRVSRGEKVTLSPVNGPDGIREITEAFNAMQENLARIVTGRTLMVAAIGHDLRTPLTSLRIRVELVEDENLRQAMIQTLDDMSVMVDETLEFAKNSAKHEPARDVIFNHFVREVVEEQHMRNVDIKFISELDDQYTYRCRPVHLKRALNNLINNAACYGAVTVRLYTSGQWLKIEILDEGPGMDPQMFDHVFEPFVRLDSARSQVTGGTGLGLTTAHSCVRAHGGDIVLANRSPTGLCATIELPI